MLATLLLIWCVAQILVIGWFYIFPVALISGTYYCYKVMANLNIGDDLNEGDYEDDKS